MQVVIFGATGRTGKPLIQQSIIRDHVVRAFVRNPQKMTLQHPRLSMVVGDVLNPPQVDDALKDQEAVLVALGTGTSLRPTLTLSTGTQNIVKAMQQHRIKRIVVVLSGWIFQEARPHIFRALTAEHERQLKILQESDLDWTAVCPPEITDARPTGIYEVAAGTIPPNGRQISKYDLADFMVLQLDDEKFMRQAVGIAH